MNQIRVNNQLNKSCEQSCDMHSVCSMVEIDFYFFLKIYSNCYNYCDSNYTQSVNHIITKNTRLSKMCHSIGYTTDRKIFAVKFFH